MFDTVIQGIFSSTADITLGGFLIGVGSALVLGIAMAYMYMYKNKYIVYNYISPSVCLYLSHLFDGSS